MMGAERQSERGALCIICTIFTLPILFALHVCNPKLSILLSFSGLFVNVLILESVSNGHGL